MNYYDLQWSKECLVGSTNLNGARGQAKQAVCKKKKLCNLRRLTSLEMLPNLYRYQASIFG
jgi:hypothetical protein